MSSESSGRSKHERPQITRAQPIVRAEHVIRLHALPTFLGVSRTAIDDMVHRGLLTPFNLSGRGRSKVVLESEIVALQQEQFARAKAKAAAFDDDGVAADAAERPDKSSLRQRLRSRSGAR